jgi:transaldolase
VTVPAKILRQWAEAGFPLPDEQFNYHGSGEHIGYQEINLDQPWRMFNIEHELTTKGVQKFAADYRATLSSKAD